MKPVDDESIVDEENIEGIANYPSEYELTGVLGAVVTECAVAQGFASRVRAVLAI